MRLFHFRSEKYHCVIFSLSFNDALVQFCHDLADLYGSTLQGWKSSRETDSLTVCWREDREAAIKEDTFHIAVWPANTTIYFNSSSFIFRSKLTTSIPAKTIALRPVPISQ